MLIDAGADVEEENSIGLTPFQYQEKG